MSLFYHPVTMTAANNELLLSDIKQFFEENESFTKKDLVSFVSKSFDSHKTAAPRKKSVKQGKKEEGDEKPKRPPTAYQLFVKATLPELKAREDAKGEGEEKLKQTELIKEVAKMWKEQQTAVKEDLMLAVIDDEKTVEAAPKKRGRKPKNDDEK